MQAAHHGEQAVVVDGHLLDELAVEVDQLSVARDGGGARGLVAGEHPGQVAEDAPRAGDEVDAGRLERVDGVERELRDDVVLAPDEGGVQV